MKVRFLIIVFCQLIYSINGIGQNSRLPYLKGKVSYIQTYGIEDLNTIDLVKELISDTNNIVVFDLPSFTVRYMMNGHYKFGEYMGDACYKQIESLQKVKGIDNFNSYDFEGKFNFPQYYFKMIDSLKYSKLTNPFKDDDIKNSILQMDSIHKIEFANLFVDEYNLSRLDSLILLKGVFGELIREDDFSKFEPGKKVIFLLNDYERKNDVTIYKTHDLNKTGNVYFILPNTILR